MTGNLSTIDGGIRLLIATVLTGLIANHSISGLAATVSLFTAFALLITVVFGFCPIYFLFGLNTERDRHHHAH